MANTPGIPIVSGFDVTTSFTTMYTSASNIRTVLDSVTFNNYSDLTVELSVRIVQNGDSSSSLTELITNRKIRPGDSYLASELLGQSIGKSGTIEAKASTALSINANITATEIQ